MLFNADGVEKESSASKNDFNPKDLAAQDKVSEVVVERISFRWTVGCFT